MVNSYKKAVINMNILKLFQKNSPGWESFYFIPGSSYCPGYFSGRQ